MNITKLSNGNLEMTANVNDRKDIRSLLRSTTSELAAESIFISEMLINPMGDGVSYEQVAPEDVGALTSAPLISDGTHVYGFMDYAIHCFLRKLIDGEPVIWQKG
jgi:hypothetical protein